MLPGHDAVGGGLQVVRDDDLRLDYNHHHNDSSISISMELALVLIMIIVIATIVIIVTLIIKIHLMTCGPRAGEDSSRAPSSRR